MVRSVMGLSSENWFDFLVIGSGTAGSVLAARLSEQAELRVGLIHSKRPPNEFGTTLLLVR